MSQTSAPRPPRPPRDPRDAGHPDLAEIEAVRTGEAAPEVADHVKRCNECRAALGELGGLAESVKAAAALQLVEISARVDKVVFAAIDKRVRALRSGNRRLAAVRWAAPLAAAATLLLAVGLWTASGPRRESPHGAALQAEGRRSRLDTDSPTAAATPATAITAVEEAAVVDREAGTKRGPLRDDFDGSGTVDIVDAYLLSRAVRRGARLERHWDINRDGKVDGRDAEAVARRAVSVFRGGA